MGSGLAPAPPARPSPWAPYLSLLTADLTQPQGPLLAGAGLDPALGADFLQERGHGRSPREPGARGRTPRAGVGFGPVGGSGAPWTCPPLNPHSTDPHPPPPQPHPLGSTAQRAARSHSCTVFPAENWPPPSAQRPARWEHQARAAENEMPGTWAAEEVMQQRKHTGAESRKRATGIRRCCREEDLPAGPGPPRPWPGALRPEQRAVSPGGPLGLEAAGHGPRSPASSGLRSGSGAVM